MSRIPPAITRAYVVLAAAATLVAAGVHLATYGPEGWTPVLSAIWPLLFFGIFPLYLLVAFALAGSHLPLDVLISDLPRPVKIAGGILLGYVLVNFAIAFRLLQGAHAEDPIYTARLFTGHALFFYAASAALGYQVDRVRRGFLNVSGGPRDDTLEQAPLPAPLSRSVVLQTRLARAECAARLARWPGLRGEATPDLFRLDLARSESSLVYAVGRFEGESPTFIRLLLTFKRFYLVVIASTVLILPLVAWVMSGVQFAWQGVLFVILFGGGGNIVYGIVQMRRLERQIRRATESQTAPIG